ncbi:MAG: BrnT family toxin [Candidatus Binatia bacterium]
MPSITSSCQIHDLISGAALYGKVGQRLRPCRPAYSPHSRAVRCTSELGLVDRIDEVHTSWHSAAVDVRFELNGTAFVWDEEKARMNIAVHEGITFERAAEVFFDPFFRLVEASRNDEARDAAIGYDTVGRLLFVVHIEVESEYIRIISARKATLQERKDHDS